VGEKGLRGEGSCTVVMELVALPGPLNEGWSRELVGLQAHHRPFL